MIIPRDVSRCPGIDQTTKATCPERDRCKRYLAGVEDNERKDAWTDWTNFFDPSALLTCTDNWKHAEGK